MNFFKIFLLLAVVMAVFLGQTEAGWLKKIGKQIEGVGRRTRDATIKALDVAQQAANVVQTVKGVQSAAGAVAE